jgi:hypothetical protein
MAAPFLRDLKALGHPVVTVLRTDQYDGLESFTEVGMFVPLEQDRHGQVVREVAPACFALPLPDQKGQFLPLRVALIRDLRRRVPCTQQEEETDEDGRKPAWWQAEPAPTTPTKARADSHCHHRRHHRCPGTCPDLHTALASARKHHS